MWKSRLIRILCAAIVLGVMGCDTINSKIPHSGGIYSIDTDSLQATLPEKLQAGFQPPPQVVQNNRPVATTTYVAIKLYEISPDEVHLKYTLQEGELPITSSHFKGSDFTKFVTVSTKLSRREFDTLTPKLEWVADGDTSDWHSEEVK